MNDHAHQLKILQRFVAIGLILTPLYHTGVAISEIFTFQKQLVFIENVATLDALKIELLKKAIAISFGLFFDSFYGFALLIKPITHTRAFHIITGIFLFILSNIVFHLSSIDNILKNIQFLPLT